MNEKNTSWENDFYEVLPIIKSNLTLDAKVARIKVIFEKILATREKEAYEEGKIFGNRENARVKNSGKLLYQTGWKDAISSYRTKIVEAVENIKVHPKMRQGNPEDRYQDYIGKRDIHSLIKNLPE